jgi:hypothetical protein
MMEATFQLANNTAQPLANVPNICIGHLLFSQNRRSSRENPAKIP